MVFSFSRGCAVMAMCLMLSACASNPQAQGGANGQRPLTADEQRLRELTDSYNGTVATGAIVGCLAGGILGALIADKKNRGAGAGIGCAAGGAVGAGAGVAVANSNERAAKIEDSLRGQIAAAQAFNSQLDQSITASRNTVRDTKARLNDLKAKVARGAATRQQLEDEQAATAGSLKLMGDNLNAAIKKRNEYAQMVQQVPQIKGQIRDMDGKILSIQRDCDEMRQGLGVSPVG